MSGSNKFSTSLFFWKVTVLRYRAYSYLLGSRRQAVWAPHWSCVPSTTFIIISYNLRVTLLPRSDLGHNCRGIMSTAASSSYSANLCSYLKLRLLRQSAHKFVKSPLYLPKAATLFTPNSIDTPTRKKNISSQERGPKTCSDSIIQAKSRLKEVSSPSHFL